MGSGIVEHVGSDTSIKSRRRIYPSLSRCAIEACSRMPRSLIKVCMNYLSRFALSNISIRYHGPHTVMLVDCTLMTYILFVSLINRESFWVTAPAELGCRHQNDLHLAPFHSPLKHTVAFLMILHTRKLAHTHQPPSFTGLLKRRTVILDTTWLGFYVQLFHVQDKADRWVC